MEFIVFTDSYGIEHIQIDKGDEGFVSMPKAIWDELQVQKELGGTL
jgi:hypothetical protein